MSTAKLIIASLLVVCVLVAGIVLVSSQIAAAASVTGNLPSSDQEQIEVVIQQWYEFHYEASINGGDVSKFPTVLVDTDDYPLDSDQQKMVQEVLGQIKAAGYLSMMQAQYKVLGEGSAMLQAAIAKAKQENREINKDEMDEIIRKNHGVFPPVILEGQEKATLEFETFQAVDDEKVIVRLHDGIRLVEFTLVKVDETWFISCGKTVKIDA